MQIFNPFLFFQAQSFRNKRLGFFYLSKKKRYIPEKPRFYRGFSRLRGVDFFVTKYGCKTDIFKTDRN